MDLLERNDFYTRTRRLLQSARLRPNTGSLWKDCVFLLILVMVQTTLLPTFLPALVHIDLVTPWLVISFVRQRVAQATLLAFIAALTLETHSAIPAGLYVCVYWIAANVIIQVRPALSWRHQVPWAVTYAVTTLWVSTFEAFVIMMTRGVAELHWTYWLTQMIRLITAVGFGMFLAQEWLKIDAEEPVPQ
jgi:hypothetical protein